LTQAQLDNYEYYDNKYNIFHLGFFQNFQNNIFQYVSKNSVKTRPLG